MECRTLEPPPNIAKLIKMVCYIKRNNRGGVQPTINKMPNEPKIITL